MSELQSAVLFTPGRASYITSEADGSFSLNLTESSADRGNIARDTFDENFHTTALYAGGYPAVAGWPSEHIPPLGRREADLMALPLRRKLSRDGWADEAITQRLVVQGESSDSIGDVAIAIQEGLLNPNDFHRQDQAHGVDLNTGWLHGVRFRMILRTALDIDPKLINQLPTRDTYGTPATEFQAKVSRPIAVAQEVAGVVLTYRALRGVVPGDLESLLETQEKLNDTIAKLARS